MYTNNNICNLSEVKVKRKKNRCKKLLLNIYKTKVQKLNVWSWMPFKYQACDLIKIKKEYIFILVPILFNVYYRLILKVYNIWAYVIIRSEVKKI